MAYKGGNFEDAYVISESAAKKLTSEHLYQHGLDFDDKFKPGKAPFVSLIASKFDKRLLDQLDTDGVVKPGTVLKYGDPIIVGVRQKDDAANKVHKKGRPSFNDASLTWDSEHPAIVRDVVKTKKGFMVVTTSESPMQIVDKLSGRAGNKGVISMIVPDHEIPKDGQGNPFEVLAKIASNTETIPDLSQRHVRNAM
jgi:DNA-directed RNA polymerase subunit beta